MPEYIYDIDQRTPEWDALRIGSIGGCAINSVLSKGQGKSRQTLLYQLASEILSGVKTDGFQSQAMQRGIELEPEAREGYEFLAGTQVDQVAIVKPDHPGRVHVSPDGLVGDNGGIEIKVMLPHTYIELVDTGKIALQYLRQCQHFLWVTGRKWIDFVAYCPEITSRPIWIARQEPNEKIQAAITTEIPLFLAELKTLINKVAAQWLLSRNSPASFKVASPCSTTWQNTGPTLPG